MGTRKVVDAKTGEEVEGAPLTDWVHQPELVGSETGPKTRLRPKAKVQVKPKPKPKTQVQPDPAAGARLKVKPPTPVEETEDLTPPSPVQMIVCLRPDRVLKKGRVTGNQYVFEGGKPVAVDVRDVGYLKAAVRGSRSCCGGSGETRIFVEQHEL